jgi:hypothetical protein
MTAPGRRLSASATVVLALVCIALAAPAFAFASKSTRGVVVPKLASKSVTATCPKGEHVSFGGVVAQFASPPHSGPIVLPEGMRRTAPDRWTVTGTSASDVTGSRLTAEAYCDRGPVSATVSNSVKVGGFRAGTAIATCPAGTVVVGGGYNAGASKKNQEIVARLAALSANKWAASVFNISTTATTLTALAYCAKHVPVVGYVTAVTLAAHKGGTARVSCAKGTSLVFGGLYASSPTVGKKVAAIAPFSWTAASKTQWVVTAYNAGDVAGSIDALAYCA